VARRRPLLPQNPVIEVGGRVICLPCDSADVFALNALTGELLWSSPRRGARYLAAVDGSRVLLASPHVSLRSVHTGAAVHDAKVEIRDRPAVTSKAILGVGPKGFARLGLDDLGCESIPVASPEALLGNLVVSGQGYVVSANVGGVSVFDGHAAAPRGVQPGSRPKH
jgi:outer membrane protein assembly factor BamB